MKPELAKRLAVVFPRAFVQNASDTGVAAVAGVASRLTAASSGVADAPRYARNRQELPQLRPLRLGSVASADPDEFDNTEFDPVAVEERAALAADSVPACYLDAWALLNHQTPASVPEAKGRLALDDGGRFLDAWGAQAAKLGWRSDELFGIRAGLVWRLAGERVEAIGRNGVRLSDGRAFAQAYASDQRGGSDG